MDHLFKNEYPPERALKAKVSSPTYLMRITDLNPVE